MGNKSKSRKVKIFIFFYHPLDNIHLPDLINHFYRTQVNLGSDLWVRMSVRDVWLDLTDVTLADEDTNSILADNAKGAIQGNGAMQVMSDLCMWRHLMAKFATYASGAIW